MSPSVPVPETVSSAFGNSGPVPAGALLTVPAIGDVIEKSPSGAALSVVFVGVAVVAVDAVVAAVAEVLPTRSVAPTESPTMHAATATRRRD
jgi:hypothetical protein